MTPKEPSKRKLEATKYRAALIATLVFGIGLLVVILTNSPWSDIGSALMSAGLVSLGADIFLKRSLMSDVLDWSNASNVVRNQRLTDVAMVDCIDVSGLIRAGSTLSIVLPEPRLLNVNRLADTLRVRDARLEIYLPSGESDFTSLESALKARLESPTTSSGSSWGVDIFGSAYSTGLASAVGSDGKVTLWARAMDHSTEHIIQFTFSPDEPVSIGAFVRSEHKVFQREASQPLWSGRPPRTKES